MSSHLVKFARDWDRKAPLLIHCWAGISRSTAAAFITLCALNPDIEELELARALRRASPTAYPNRLLVALADEALVAQRAHDGGDRGYRARQNRRGSRRVRIAGATRRLNSRWSKSRRKAPHLAAATESSDPKIELGLNAAIVTVREQQPYILVVAARHGRVWRVGRAALRHVRAARPPHPRDRTCANG